MELELEIMTALCATETFNINGIEADSEDFGNKADLGRDYAEDYGCGDMTFEGSEATQGILEKYSITTEEYKEIVSQLEDGLSFGGCGWCV